MLDIQVLPFKKTRHRIQGVPLDKRTHVKVLELPVGSRILSAEDKSRGGTLMLWALTPMAQEDTEVRTIIVAYEGEDFEIPEDFEATPEFDLDVSPIGMWVDYFDDPNGIVPLTGHVFEIFSNASE